MAELLYVAPGKRMVGIQGKLNPAVAAVIATGTDRFATGGQIYGRQPFQER